MGLIYNGGSGLFKLQQYTSARFQLRIGTIKCDQTYNNVEEEVVITVLLSDWVTC